MDQYIAQYYRCPESYIQFVVKGALSERMGYFQFGTDLLCHGRLSGDQPSPSPSGPLFNVMDQVAHKDGVTYIPFDAREIADNLRCEKYAAATSYYRTTFLDSVLKQIYYSFRPLMPAPLRKHLQKAWMMNGSKLQFPAWPIDCTVDRLFEQLLLLRLKSSNVGTIPFIWFWPNGAPSCAIMSHDVETKSGRDFCAKVMDLDDAYGIKSSFSIVPESRYEVPTSFLDSIWARGFEVIVQDLNHDGLLFRDRKEYLKRMKKINSYGKQYGATGFRSAVLYRNQAWFDALEFSYDMSVPNVGHLEAQRGGCCTVMPYFIGNVLEIPVTTTQDYALFNYLNTQSIDLWNHQIQLIMEHHGVINFIIHPDYITKPREWNVYQTLLSRLVQLREKFGIWIATAGEVDRWWRQRAAMAIVKDRDGLRIEGGGSERARIAYASVKDGKLAVTISPGPSKAMDSCIAQ